jgi:hypothetical protein
VSSPRVRLGFVPIHPLIWLDLCWNGVVTSTMQFCLHLISFS